MLTFFKMSLQVHGEQRGAGGVVGAPDWPVVTTDLMFSAEEQRVGFVAALFVYVLRKQREHNICHPYLRDASLMVNGQPSGSTSYAPGFPATVEVEAPAPVAPLAVALQPYLQ